MASPSVAPGAAAATAVGASNRVRTTKLVSSGGPMALILLVAGFFLWLALRGVDLQHTLATIRSANVGLLLPAALIFSVSFAVRTGRWHLILSGQQPVRPSIVFWANMAGYLGNHILPARTGEVIRTALLCRHSRFSKSFILATALTERMLDAAILVLLSALVFATFPNLPPVFTAGAWIVAFASAAGVVLLFLIPVYESGLLRLLLKLPVPARFHVRVTHMLSEGMLGLRAFHAPSKMAGFVGLAVVIWSLDAVMAVMVGQALSIPVSFTIALLLLSALGLSSIVPSTPGAIGIYQFVCISVLMPFAIDRNSALAYALVLQALAYCVVAFWGLLGFWRLSGRPAL